MKNSLLSIIIATYNRGHLIEETLRSIQQQEYQQWECIIIDDHSTDHTETVVSAFAKADARFTYELRPSYLPKGANSCRNYGFSKSKGAFIKFFDSDDIMLPNHLSLSLMTLQDQGLDFVVADCINFNEEGIQQREYEIDRSNAVLSAIHFAKHQVAWITNDLLLKREWAAQLKFNEEIRDVANEYQYNIKLLLLTTNGTLLSEILTHRRIHNQSMTTGLHKDPIAFYYHLAELRLFTAEYVSSYADRHFLKWLLSGYIQYAFRLALQHHWPQYLRRSAPMLIRTFGVFKTASFNSSLVMAYVMKKGYQFNKYSRSL